MTITEQLQQSATLFFAGPPTPGCHLGIARCPSCGTRQPGENRGDGSIRCIRCGKFADAATGRDLPKTTRRKRDSLGELIELLRTGDLRYLTNTELRSVRHFIEFMLWRAKQRAASDAAGLEQANERREDPDEKR